MKMSIILSWVLMALGYWSLYFVTKGHLNQVPIALLTLGLSVLIMFDAHVKKAKRNDH